MSVSWRPFSRLSLIAVLSVAPGWPSPPAKAVEPAKVFAHGEVVRLTRDSAGRATALEFLGCPEATLAELKNHPAVDDALARLITVHVVDVTAKADQPAVLGTFAIDGRIVRFKPRYPLPPGMEYRLTLRPVDPQKAPEANGDKVPRNVTFVIKVPEEAKRPPAEVARVYPSAAVLPENHLRFYIHFSEPMSRGNAYEHLHLLDHAGRPIEQSFLELGEELWDESARRLTLLIDPSRIKQGLKPREDLGPVLESGHEYTLVIDATLADATGRPLAKEFRKSFNVEAPVTTAIDPREWKIQSPRVGSTATLIVRFPRSLDRALMERTLAVVDADGKSVPGQVIVGNEECRWEYLPDQVWAQGSYQLVIDTVLEDLAGNQIGRPFEVDEKKPSESKAAPAKVRITFVIGTAPASAAAR